ncbi:ribokinase [Microbacterium mangrovi]|uniref:ribokinase n=1 Tax=Microbacterium mangrovi TaxID=1348253 RepID=UPI000ACC8197|nr:ribokinase [Microbacterium mangrovi]
MSIVVVGSLNADLTIRARRLPTPGETVRGDRFTVSAGGKGANQAAAAALLGANVDLIGAIGSDAHGEMLTEVLQLVGVRTGHIIVRHDHPSGVALIAVDANGENQIVVHPGANAALASDDVVGVLTRTAPAVVGISLEVDVEVAAATARAAAESGATVVVNLSPFATPPEDLLGDQTVLVVNEREASQLIGTDISALPDGKVPPALRAAGAGRVVITRGSVGALVVENGLLTVVAAIPVNAVDTTGCGDAFFGALLWRLDAGDSLADATATANLVGAYAAEGHGTIGSYPTATELGRLNDRWAVPAH